MISPNKTQSVTKVSPKTYQPTVPTVTSASKDAKWTSHDDEMFCASRIFPGSSFVSDLDMQHHTRDNLKVTCPGTPDATVFEGGTTLEGDVWNVKCLQVCRGYSRKHVNAMIAEKVYTYIYGLRDTLFPPLPILIPPPPNPRCTNRQSGCPPFPPSNPPFPAAPLRSPFLFVPRSTLLLSASHPTLTCFSMTQYSTSG